MYFEKIAAEAIFKAVKSEKCEVKFEAPCDDGYIDCLHIMVHIDIKEKAVKSFSLNCEYPNILSYELTANATLINRYSGAKTQTLTMSKTIDPELITDTNHNIIKGNLNLFKDGLIKNLAHEIVLLCKKRKPIYQPLPNIESIYPSNPKDYAVYTHAVSSFDSKEYKDILDSFSPSTKKHRITKT